MRTFECIAARPPGLNSARAAAACRSVRDAVLGAAGQSDVAGLPRALSSLALHHRTRPLPWLRRRRPVWSPKYCFKAEPTLCLLLKFTCVSLFFQQLVENLQIVEACPLPIFAWQRSQCWESCDTAPERDLRPARGSALFKRSRGKRRQPRSRNVQSQSEISVSCWRSLQVSCRKRVCCWLWAEERRTSSASFGCLASPESRWGVRVANTRTKPGVAFSDPRIWRHVLPGRRLRCL